MLKNVSIILSVVAALGLSFAVLSSSYAAPQQNKNKNFQGQTNFQVKKNFQGQQNFQVKKNFQGQTNFQSKKSFQGQSNVKFKNFRIGQRYNNYLWYGPNRHRWHGVWYGYGVGPCWINVDGLWFWNDLVCP